MPSRDRLVFFVTLPDGRRVHRIAAGDYGYATVVRVGTHWTLEGLFASRAGAERRAAAWRVQTLTAECPRNYEALVAPTTRDELPPGGAVRATLPSGVIAKARYWPTLGDGRPRWCVAVATGSGWRAAAWPVDEQALTEALSRARQEYPRSEPQAISTRCEEARRPSNDKLCDTPVSIDTL